VVCDEDGEGMGELVVLVIDGVCVLCEMGLGDGSGELLFVFGVYFVEIFVG